ncbi:MAG: hypothetical protein JHC87_08720 [Thermoleophilaceae bacterium]|nr:hypothetical protein [Thermoleophilaceae bacterium]
MVSHAATRRQVIRNVDWAHKDQHGTFEHIALIFDAITLSRVGVGLELGSQ